MTAGLPQYHCAGKTQMSLAWKSHLLPCSSYPGCVQTLCQTAVVPMPIDLNMTRHACCEEQGHGFMIAISYADCTCQIEGKFLN